jgi:hypothetical protein
MHENQGDSHGQHAVPRLAQGERPTAARWRLLPVPRSAALAALVAATALATGCGSSQPSTSGPAISTSVASASGGGPPADGGKAPRAKPKRHRTHSRPHRPAPSKPAQARRRHTQRKRAHAPAATNKPGTHAPAPITKHTAHHHKKRPAAHSKPKPAAPAAHSVNETANLHLLRRKGLTFIQQGPVEGTNPGQMLLAVTPGGPGATATFTVTLPDGTIRGTGAARLTPAGSTLRFTGTATITGGTGTYKHASGHNLSYSGTSAADGSSTTVRLRGNVRY